MIEVKVTYEMIDYHLDKHIKYLEVIVKGHARPNYSGNNHLKVCSSVSAVTAGSAVLIDDFENMLKIEKGLFHFIYKNDRYDVKTQNTIDVVVCQLWFIYQRYPKYFKAFELQEKESAICQTPKNPKRQSGCSSQSTKTGLSKTTKVT